MAQSLWHIHPSMTCDCAMFHKFSFESKGLVCRALQVRDEVRQSFDAGRMDTMSNVYSKGMGDAAPPGPPPVGQKRSRHSQHDGADQDGGKRQRGTVSPFSLRWFE